MQVSDIPVLRNYSHHLQLRIPKFKEGKYVQIIVLRETKSYVVFTYDNQTMHVERMPAGVMNSAFIERIVMHSLKQIAPERGTGRALLRQFKLSPHQSIKDPNVGSSFPQCECRVSGRACGVCPDCILYGYTTTSGERSDSQYARVLADSGFVVRSLPQVTKNIILNGFCKADDGRILQDLHLQNENIVPEVFIPTVETLVDVTKEELVYVIGNILRTTRYGAGRGFVRNHILGLCFSDVEVFSNLEMTQFFYDFLSVNGSVTDSLALKDYTDNLVSVVNECIRGAVGRISIMTDEEVSELIHDISVIYSDEQYLMEFLKSLSEMAIDYATQINKCGYIQEADDKYHRCIGYTVAMI